MDKESLLTMLKDLDRLETEERPGASVKEVISGLIASCEFLLKNMKDENVD